MTQTPNEVWQISHNSCLTPGTPMNTAHAFSLCSGEDSDMVYQSNLAVPKGNSNPRIVRPAYGFNHLFDLTSPSLANSS
jgi:hypothetical protein